MTAESFPDLEKKEKVNPLEKQLEEMDFKDYDAIFNWLLEYKKFLEKEAEVPEKLKKEAVALKFKENGFSEDDYWGLNHNLEDKEVYAKYVIGSLIAMNDPIEKQRLNLNITKNIDIWLEKFGKN